MEYPGGGQHLPKTRLTSCWEHGHNSHSGNIGTEWLIVTAPESHVLAVPPARSPRDPVVGIVQVHKTHVDWMDKLP